jgi:zinc/manganese transport system permease protein
LLPITVLSALVLVAWFWLGAGARTAIFYPLFAVVVTASVQIVGIYLVFASLIIPALSTTRISRGNRLVAGYVVGGVAYLLGIIVSLVLDLPTGAVIVWSMAAVALLAGLVMSDKGRPA